MVVRRLISSLEKKASIPAISILSAIMWLLKAWNKLPDKIFTNCFRKCGISEETAASAIADDDNPFAALKKGTSASAIADDDNPFAALKKDNEDAIN